VEAFELRENNQDDAELKRILDEWRESFNCPADYTEPVVQQELDDLEKELRNAYSPISLTKERIREINNAATYYLSQHGNDKIIKDEDALLIIRLLCNCGLIENCFFPLIEDICENQIDEILNQLNICIVVSQLDYFSDYFKHILFNFNREFISIKEASAHIFHIVGVLNFKCHNYPQVIEFFTHAINRFESEYGTEVYKNDEYFQTRLLLAYCYEYSHKFELAITELIGLDVVTLIKLFKNSNFSMFNIFDSEDIGRAKARSEAFISNILKNKIIEEAPNALFLVADKRDVLNHKVLGDKHEILHSIAHCLNELGIDWKITSGKEKESIVHLLSLSRAIMLYIAEFDANCLDFQTCLYMIFAEAKDYDISLKRINTLVDEYKRSAKKNINYEMENMFYLFLVSNQSNKTISDASIKKEAEEAYNRFVSFAKRRYDYDALIHIEVFRFRFEIVKALRSSFNNSQIAQKLVELKTKPVGIHIFSIKPSAKMNQWIVQEYNKTVALYEFLVKLFDGVEEMNINELYNFASRFVFYRNQFFPSYDNTPGLGTKEDIIEDAIDLIVEDFISPQSIFLLAPLTSAIPYQHQTKSLNALEESIFSSEMKKINIEEKMECFTDLNDIGIGAVDGDVLKWLFGRKEFDISFIACKYDSDITFDRYCFSTNGSEIFERPILNIDRLNFLITKKILRTNKAHEICKNGQAHCCTTIVSDDKKKYILEICAELMLPYEKNHDKHFVFFYKGKTGGKRSNHSWYIIALNNEPNVLQAEEITLKLCGHNLQPKRKLAQSTQNHCFVGFDISDGAVATNDLFSLQEGHDFRCWYNREMLWSGIWTESALKHLDSARCIMCFISTDTMLSEQSGVYKEILYSFDKKLPCIIVAVGFINKQDFETALLRKIMGNNRYKDVQSYLLSEDTLAVFRQQKGFNIQEHLSEDGVLLSKLKEFGVMRDGH